MYKVLLFLEFNMAVSIHIVILLFGVCSAAEITNIRLYRDQNNNTTSTGAVLLEYDGEWVSACHHGDKKNWGKREAIVACRQLHYEGGWPYDVTEKDFNFPTQHLNNFDCGAKTIPFPSLSNLEDCVYGVSGECDSKLAGIHCYDSFEVRLNGGDAPNTGRVEVRYDDVWSDVCYESARSEKRTWSFSNVQVVCRELGFPGAMFSRQGGMGFGNKQSIVDGYKCREATMLKRYLWMIICINLIEHSLRDCFPNSPTLPSPQGPGPSCEKGNEAVALCAVPGYMGCFKTNGNAQMKLKGMQSPHMTISMCRKHCMRYNYTHAFLHQGDTCFCGIGIPLNHVDDSRCGKECTGDMNQVCGHYQTVSVYNVMSGMCDNPLNDTNIYYYGDIFDNFKSDCTSKQCVMGESPNEMKWIDIFPQCTDTGVSESNLGIAVRCVVFVFLLLIIVIVVVVPFLRKQHTHRKTEHINDPGINDTETALKQLRTAKLPRNDATKKKDLNDTRSGWIPFGFLSTEGDANQSEPTSGETKAITESQVAKYTRFAETDCKGKIRVTQNEYKKKETKKGQNKDGYKQVPHDVRCLAEADDKAGDNASGKDEKSTKTKEKHDKPVTEKDVSYIVEVILPNELPFVYTALGLKLRDVQRAEQGAATTDTKLKARAVFFLWIQRNGSDATRQKVLDALDTLKYTASLEELLKTWNM